MCRSLWTYRAATAFFLPDARVIGLVAAQCGKPPEPVSPFSPFRLRWPLLLVSSVLLNEVGVY